MKVKGSQGVWWFLIFVGVMLAGCGSRLPEVSPPLRYGQPTPEEKVLYGYMVALAAGDFERLKAFASPQAFDQAQRWWQSLSAQERRLFRQNMGLMARIGTGWLGYPADDTWVVLYFDTSPVSNTVSHSLETETYYASVDLIGAEYYLLYEEPSIVQEDFKVPLILFMLRLQQVKVKGRYVEEWRNICWLVHPYPGEFYGGLKDGASSLQCLYP